MRNPTKTRFYIFDIIIYVILILLAIITLYPFLNSLAISLNDANDTARGGIGIIPRKFTFQNYLVIAKNHLLYDAYLVTILRTAVGTAGSVLATGMLSYGMSKPYLKGRRIYMTLCIITMYFSGGLIPYYLLIRELHLTNNFLVYIIPNLISVWNMIIMITYFKGLPESIEESAKIDGAGAFTIFFRIVMPVSAPIIATIALFNCVFHWNSWFDASIFITDQKLKPVQSILMSIINSSKFAEEISKAGPAATQLSRMNLINVRSVTMATMIVTIVPIIMVYPFLQKYFVKGIMIGSIKG